MRCYPALAFLAERLLKKPFRNKDKDINALLLIGLYQLRELRTPAHAAISETVNAAKQRRKQWAGGLLNACLRNYQRQSAELEAALAEHAEARYGHADWWLKQYQQDWPENWQPICEANNQQPPMMLRVNRQRLNRQAYLDKLAEAGVDAQILQDTDDGILLSTPCDVGRLPGFFDGEASVQDGAAQKVAALLDIRPEQRILDACAAPGGKTGHMLEVEPGNTVIALDIAPQRLSQIDDNLTRLQLQGTTQGG